MALSRLFKQKATEGTCDHLGFLIPLQSWAVVSSGISCLLEYFIAKLFGLTKSAFALRFGRMPILSCGPN